MSITVPPIRGLSAVLPHLEGSPGLTSENSSTSTESSPSATLAINTLFKRFRPSMASGSSEADIIYSLISTPQDSSEKSPFDQWISLICCIARNQLRGKTYIEITDSEDALHEMCSSIANQHSKEHEIAMSLYKDHERAKLLIPQRQFNEIALLRQECTDFLQIDSNRKQSQWRNAFLAAAAKGDALLVQELLSPPSLIEHPCGEEAASTHPNEVQLLIDIAFAQAFKNNWQQIAIDLLQRTTAPTVSSRGKDIALEDAVSYCEKEKIQWLLENAIGPQVSQHGINKALILAVEKSSEEIASYLCPKASQEGMDEALNKATIQRNQKMMQFLLERTTDPQISQAGINAAFQSAALKKDTESMSFLYDKVSQEGMDETFRELAMKGDQQTMNWLLTGPHVTKVSTNAMDRALIWAAHKSHNDLVSWLLNRSEEPRVSVENGKEQALYRASIAGNQIAVKELIKECSTDLQLSQHAIRRSYDAATKASQTEIANLLQGLIQDE